MDLHARLRALRDALPRGGSVSLTREALDELLVEDVGPEDVDLTVEDVAERLGRAASTVRTWCGDGRLPNAYRLHGREWRIPRDSLRQLRDGPGPEPARDGRPADLGAWREVARG